MVEDKFRKKMEDCILISIDDDDVQLIKQVVNLEPILIDLTDSDENTDELPTAQNPQQQQQQQYQDQQHQQHREQQQQKQHQEQHYQERHHQQPQQHEHEHEHEHEQKQEQEKEQDNEHQREQQRQDEENLQQQQRKQKLEQELEQQRLQQLEQQRLQQLEQQRLQQLEQQRQQQLEQQRQQQLEQQRQQQQQHLEQLRQQQQQPPDNQQHQPQHHQQQVQEQKQELTPQQQHELMMAQKALGNEKYNNNLFDEAIRIYKKANELAKKLGNKEMSAILHFNLAMTYYRLGSFDQAADECAYAVKINDNYLKAHLKRAEIYQRQGKIEEAVICYEHICELDSSNRDYAVLLNYAREAAKKIKKRDSLQILGLRPNFTQEDLKKAYRHKALSHHPDRHSDADIVTRKIEEKRFKDASEAHTFIQLRFGYRR